MADQDEMLVLRNRYFRAITLALALAAGSAHALEPTMSIFVETPLRPVIHGATNLPDGSQLMLTLLRPESGYVAQSKMTVVGGHFNTERFSAGGNPLNPGKYRVQIVMIGAELQPKSVQAVIGPHGQLMVGELMKPSPIGGPMMEYETQTQLGGPANAVLDAQAKAISNAELQRWVVESCAETIDLVDAGVKNGTLAGRQVSGAARKQKIDECIARVNGPKVN